MFVSVAFYVVPWHNDVFLWLLCWFFMPNLFFAGLVSLMIYMSVETVCLLCLCVSCAMFPYLIDCVTEF